MTQFEQHFCGVTRYRGPIVTSLSRTASCGVLIDQGLLQVVNDSNEQQIISAPIDQIGFSVPKVQGKVDSVAIHVENRKFLVDFGMVQRAESGSGSSSVQRGREIGARFLDALRESRAQPT